MEKIIKNIIIDIENIKYHLKHYEDFRFFLMEVCFRIRTR